ncbi:hypothetical protein Lal_00044131 [Lupinus albus]|uniref:Putative F-box domain-containing protein n=1 Tax=Lupinus albus TaxID=3870 RepID=A0A6A5PFM2_LUPAL|nr:putative F-box domain-containing protein [Lupinus albus]KAF1895480.1 hypothetical protein Lal_00044131 [Lupinus albus]
MAIMTRKRRRMMLESTPPSSSPSPPSPPTIILPEDLMIEILSRVTECNPLHLRCVCKWWKSLVLDPQFVKNHLHRSITDINDLASKALDDMNAFESQLNFAPEAVAVPEEVEEELERSLMNELDNMLMVVQSLKGSLETIKIDVQEISDRMKCLQSFLQIYLKNCDVI